jgi:hypothetical protein
LIKGFIPSISEDKLFESISVAEKGSDGSDIVPDDLERPA